MIQQVNLYQSLTRANQGPVTVRSTLPALSVVVAVLVGIWGFAWWQLQGMRREADFARTQRAAMLGLEAARTADLDTLPPEELDQRILAMDAEVAAKSRALQTLRSEAEQVAGFSSRLAALAQRHLDGVWLEQLTLGASRDTMSLTGSALEPNLVPRYLKSLATDPALRGGGIDHFVIDRPSTDAKRNSSHLRFRAATRALQSTTKPAEEG